MANEMVDYFDANYNHLGVTDKYNALDKAYWLHSFHCWVLQPNGKVLLQLRNKNKHDNPNKLDMGATGHIGAGETVIDGGLREIKEEIGIDVTKDDLFYIGKQLLAVDLYIEEIENYKIRQFAQTYFYKSKTELADYTMQEDEVDGLFEVAIEDALELFSERVEAIEVSGFLQNGQKETRVVSIKDFMSRERLYFLKIFIMLQRYANGEKYLAI